MSVLENNRINRRVTIKLSGMRQGLIKEIKGKIQCSVLPTVDE